MIKNSFLIVIPARAGSKRVKNKNLRKIGNISLLEKKIKDCLSIKQARIIVSTNSKEIAQKSIKWGAESPYLRPKKYSTSKASTLACVLDLLRFLKKVENYKPEYIGVMPPTNPFLKSKTIKTAFTTLKKNKEFNSVVGYTESVTHPFQFISTKKNNRIKFNLINYLGKKYSDFERTQDWPKAYTVSASVKIVRNRYLKKFMKNYSAIINLKTFDVKNSKGIKIDNIENFDINSENDLKIANALNQII